MAQSCSALLLCHGRPPAPRLTCLAAQRPSQSIASPAAELVRNFYAAVNSRQLDNVGHYFASECVYEDLVYSKPFVGRKVATFPLFVLLVCSYLFQEIVNFFNKFTGSVSSDLTFVVDEISDGELSVGVVWHLDWRGKAFPFSKGCSFYRCQKFEDNSHKIIYARDCVEPALKLDGAALRAIATVTWLLERSPWLADRL